MSNDHNRIPSLDGVRCIAVSLVLFSHLLGTRGFFSPAKTSFLYGFCLRLWLERLNTEGRISRIDVHIQLLSRTLMEHRSHRVARCRRTVLPSMAGGPCPARGKKRVIRGSLGDFHLSGHSGSTLALLQTARYRASIRDHSTRHRHRMSA